MAILVDPTNETAEIFSLLHIASTIFLSPFTTLKTPSGKPDNFNNSREDNTYHVKD